MSAWTKGRWTFDKASGTINVSGGTVCQRVSWAPDGTLMSAAPELYDELDDLIRRYEAAAMAAGMKEDEVLGVTRTHRAALAKARGER